MSLTVVYESRRFKIPVSSGMLLSQVRDQTCEALNLPPSNYGLSKQGKLVDLTVPFRFANLVNNAQVDLVRVQKAETVRVKIRVPGSKDFIGQFPSGATVQNVLDEAHLRGQLMLNNVAASPHTELASLGGAGGIMFVLNSNAAPHPPPNASQSHTRQANLASTQKQSQLPSHSSNSQAPSKNDRSPVVNVQTPQHTVPHQEEDDDVEDDEEINQSQFLAYYKHIKKQADPPMISKSTQERLKSEKRTAIESTTIRVRFPDGNTLEGKFAKGEHGSDVYDFVKMYLRQPQRPFQLISMKPHFVLEPSAHLLDDCNFGTRALLVFRCDSTEKTGFLNDKALALVKPAATSQSAQNTQSNAKSNGSAAPKQTGADTQTEPKKSLKSKITPKWLKLHKS